MSPEDLSGFSLIELFRQEVDGQAHVLTSGLLALEREPTNAEHLEACMRGAHSLKGAARIVSLDSAVRVAHVMEDCFVAAQQGRLTLQQDDIDLLLSGVDLLTRISAAGPDEPGTPSSSEIAQWLAAIEARVAGASSSATPAAPPPSTPGRAAASPPAHGRGPSPPPEPAAAVPLPDMKEDAPPQDLLPSEQGADRVLRVTAENLNRLLGLASESLVESRWIKPFTGSLLRLKRLQREAAQALEDLRDSLSSVDVPEQVELELSASRRKLQECSEVLSVRLGEIEAFDSRSTALAHRLYDEALACRMRPFVDGVQGFPRMVRDVARTLGKQARLEIIGENTRVDRDILAALDAPLGHLLRNAIDHGLETPEERIAAGKPAQGVIRLEARHHSGALQVIVADDGRGIDVERVRKAVVQRRLMRRDAADGLSEAELFEFLFLPGFTMKESITDISGRGVGLDVVRDMVKHVHGKVHVTSRPGQGTSFQLQLPVTLSVLRTLIVEIAGEPYAFPLASIVRVVKLPPEAVASLEHRQHFELDGRRVGLVAATDVLGTGASAPPGSEMTVVVLGDLLQPYGVIVDRFVGERELVVLPLDPHIGKLKDVAAGALMEDGSPVLILDVEDLLRSVDNLAADDRLAVVHRSAVAAPARAKKRVLVVDDSLTVRELERKLIAGHGYDVEVAVDGMDGWNTLRSSRFDLVVTDIDMPRMDGIELVTLINNDPALQSVPVMIVSYKDREEDRRRGLDAGAAHYLTKSSFHDETLVQAVVDLIGEADA